MIRRHTRKFGMPNRGSSSRNPAWKFRNRFALRPKGRNWPGESASPRLDKPARNNDMKQAGVPLMVTLLFFCASASAHHGNSAYDEQARVPIKGTVTEFVWTNPHSQIYLDVKEKNGNIVHWGI